MDSTTPPSHRSETCLRLKSASRLSRVGDCNGESEGTPGGVGGVALDLVPCSLSRTPPPSNPSPKPSNPSLPLHELLLLSQSPVKRSKTRLPERLEMAEELSIEPRRRCKSRASQMGLSGCGSPRNGRRSRRRTELESREEKDYLGVAEELGKPRKRRHSGRPKKEKLSLAPSVPSSTPSPKIDDGDRINLDRIGLLLSDLIFWKDVAKSSLWFGFGSLCFLSSCFARGISFSILSAISQLGLLCLGVSFLSNSYCDRVNMERRLEYKLKEDDILRAARHILPAANLVISKTRQLFSGEPCMTLKVAPLFLVGAEYGHLLTLRRLCAFGFFVSFTVPKLYSCYSDQIGNRVEYLKRGVLEAWGACSHKKIVAASAATAFWNLSTVKTRIFAAFITLVIFRYYRQLSVKPEEGGTAAGVEEVRQQQEALVSAEGGVS
ncbi:reticulon-like protein B17 [Malania oleifera]|uniref:reticulon-like protein B17 n=1 Tax=Malania oleifera TaxID=397392 RepID=UPI0025ADDD82|nr:reticulon-like protein B17 [Malania oleifera]